MASGHVIRLAGPWQCHVSSSSHSIRLPGGIPAALLNSKGTGRIEWQRRFHSPTRIDLLQQVWIELDESWGEPVEMLLDRVELKQRVGRRWSVPLQFLREAPSHELIIRLMVEESQAGHQFAAPNLILQEHQNALPPLQR